MTVTEQVQKVLAASSSLLLDAGKADKGNNAARTRVRKALIQLSKDAREARKAIAPAGAE